MSRLPRRRAKNFEEPISVVARSRRNMADAVRQALAGASRTLGGLERCDAVIEPQVLRDGGADQFQIMLSVTKRSSADRQRGS
jgi:flavin-binding protein dodecin